MTAHPIINGLHVLRYAQLSPAPKLSPCAALTPSDTDSARQALAEPEPLSGYFSNSLMGSSFGKGSLHKFVPLDQSAAYILGLFPKETAFWALLGET